ncbi:MAG: signal peptidase I [Butyrivibrio sp.]|nr:signal peptidase I [Butyrivibrio sp.]
MFRRGLFRKKRTLSFYQKKRVITPKLLKEILSWIIITCLALMLAFIIVYLYGTRVGNVGDSMEPTIANGQGLLVDRTAYKVLRPKKNDIIVFLPNGNTNSHFYVKRVVAVSGERVQIMDGELYINGKLQEDEEGLYDKMEDGGIAVSEIKLGKGEYFVLGDNRNGSEDSRNPDIGIVKDNMIVGKAWYKLRFADNAGGFIH